MCYDCHLEIRSGSLPSPGGSSTSSTHSTTSYTSNNSNSSSLASSTHTNGKARRKISSPYLPSAGLLYNTIPEERGENSKQIYKSELSTHRPRSSNQASFTQNLNNTAKVNQKSADPNQRLQNKVMQHLEANRKFKASTEAAATMQSPGPLSSSTNIHKKSAVSTNPLCGGVFYPAVSSANSNSNSHTNISSQSPNQYSNNVGSTTTTISKPSPIPQPAGVGRQDHLVAPRSVQIEHAGPQPNLRRNYSSRRRLPLNDMIMQKKIAESLKKCSGARFPAISNLMAGSKPSIGLASPPLASPSIPDQHENVAVSCTSAPPPVPRSYYMKVWQASEIANASSVPLAVPQEPVQSQELPPRLMARGEKPPPQRPPKLKSFQITRI